MRFPMFWISKCAKQLYRVFINFHPLCIQCRYCTSINRKGVQWGKMLKLRSRRFINYKLKRDGNDHVEFKRGPSCMKLLAKYLEWSPLMWLFVHTSKHACGVEVNLPISIALHTHCMIALGQYNSAINLHANTTFFLSL